MGPAIWPLVLAPFPFRCCHLESPCALLGCPPALHLAPSFTSCVQHLSAYLPACPPPLPAAPGALLLPRHLLGIRRGGTLLLFCVCSVLDRVSEEGRGRQRAEGTREAEGQREAGWSAFVALLVASECSWRSPCRQAPGLSSCPHHPTSLTPCHTPAGRWCGQLSECAMQPPACSRGTGKQVRWACCIVCAAQREEGARGGQWMAL